jgi:hypothetical protein
LLQKSFQWREADASAKKRCSHKQQTCFEAAVSPGKQFNDHSGKLSSSQIKSVLMMQSAQQRSATMCAARPTARGAGASWLNECVRASCRISRPTAARDEDVAHRISRLDQRDPCGATDQHIRFYYKGAARRPIANAR